MAATPMLTEEGVWALVRDFLAPKDLYYFHETCSMFRKLVSVESVIKSAGAGNTATRYQFWPYDDSDMVIFLRNVKIGKVYMPSPIRMLRIVLHADETMADKIGCDFCRSEKVRCFSATRGVLLCSPKCRLEAHKAGAELAKGLTWPYSELGDDVEKLLKSEPQSAAFVRWWEKKKCIYTTVEPVTDAATGERCGCTITKKDLDSMKQRPWSKEKLRAILPD
ncbi:MAG: hypothetical protein SGARI_007447, partial [Bacillariaceae sp.]